jgi:hypothetical protein
MPSRSPRGSAREKLVEARIVNVDLSMREQE